MVRSVLGLVTVHRDQAAPTERILPPALPAETSRRTAFDGIVDNLAVLGLHINILVNMGIHPFHLSHGPSNLDGLIGVVLGRKRMMCQCRQRGAGQSEGCGKNGEGFRSHDMANTLLALTNHASYMAG